jgi:hypothetical protein
MAPSLNYNIFASPVEMLVDEHSIRGRRWEHSRRIAIRGLTRVQHVRDQRGFGPHRVVRFDPEDERVSV